MSGLAWTAFGLVVAFATGYGLGLTRGTRRAAEEMGRLRGVVRTLNERSDALTEALIRAKRAPIDHDASVTILRDLEAAGDAEPSGIDLPQSNGSGN